MKATKLILPVMAISFVGLGVFFFTRKAAAASKAKQAFAVDANCGSFLSLDDELAKSAAMAAALAVHPSPDSSAIEAIKAILAFMFPQCSWVDPIPDGRTFIEQNGRSMTWGAIVLLVGDKTVAQLKDMAMQGSSSTLPGWPIRYFGTGCAACMGTGKQDWPPGVSCPSGWVRGRDGFCHQVQRTPGITLDSDSFTGGRSRRNR